MLDTGLPEKVILIDPIEQADPNQGQWRADWDKRGVEVSKPHHFNNLCVSLPDAVLRQLHYLIGFFLGVLVGIVAEVHLDDLG